MSDTNDRAKPEQPSTTTIVPRLRLNREKVKVLSIRSSLATGMGSIGGGCPQTCFHSTDSMIR